MVSHFQFFVFKHRVQWKETICFCTPKQVISMSPVCCFMCRTHTMNCVLLLLGNNRRKGQKSRQYRVVSGVHNVILVAQGLHPSGGGHACWHSIMEQSSSYAVQRFCIQVEVRWRAQWKVIRLEAQRQYFGSGSCYEGLRYATGSDKMTPAVQIGRGEKTDVYTD